MNEALRLAKRNGVNLALTNPCFELWVLLHFTDVKAYATSDQAQRLLERQAICGYSAERKHLEYGVLRDLYGEAKTRAQRLRLGAERSDGLSTNPWTDIDLLVEALKAARNG